MSQKIEGFYPHSQLAEDLRFVSYFERKKPLSPPTPKGKNTLTFSHIMVFELE